MPRNDPAGLAGLPELLGEVAAPPFAVTHAAALHEQEQEREWHRTRRCLHLDTGDSDDGVGEEGEGEEGEEEGAAGAQRSGHCPEESALGMHLVPSLVDRRLAVVRRRAGKRAAAPCPDGLRRGPLAGVRIERHHVYGGHMKVGRPVGKKSAVCPVLLRWLCTC